MISLNYRDARPIYEQIKNGLKRLIVSGALKEGDKLPSVRSLATELAINPNTIQKAYNELENEGYILDTQRKTVYVKSGETTLVEWENRFRELAAELRYLGTSQQELMELLKEGKESSHD